MSERWILRDTITLPFDYDAVIIEENPDYTEDACNGPAWQTRLRDGKYAGVGRTRDEAMLSLQMNLEQTAIFVGALRGIVR